MITQRKNIIFPKAPAWSKPNTDVWTSTFIGAVPQRDVWVPASPSFITCQWNISPRISGWSPFSGSYMPSSLASTQGAPASTGQFLKSSVGNSLSCQTVKALAPSTSVKGIVPLIELKVAQSFSKNASISFLWI